MKVFCKRAWNNRAGRMIGPRRAALLVFEPGRCNPLATPAMPFTYQMAARFHADLSASAASAEPVKILQHEQPVTAG